MRKKSAHAVKGASKGAAHPYKKIGGRTSKAGIRVVKESPVSPKIDKATINEAVEKALLFAER